MTSDTSEFLNPKEAAEFLTQLKAPIRSTWRLAQLRSQGAGPPYYKAAKNVYYTKEDLLRWLKQSYVRIEPEASIAAA